MGHAWDLKDEAHDDEPQPPRPARNTHVAKRGLELHGPLLIVRALPNAASTERPKREMHDPSKQAYGLSSESESASDSDLSSDS